MKKLVCVFLTLVMLIAIASTAFAAGYNLSGIAKGSGKSSGAVNKGSGTGSASWVDPSSSAPSNALFQATTRKTDGTNASNTVQFTGTSKVSMSTKYDGYGNALLRNGYDYKLRIAHRSNSPASGNTASTSGSWEP